ncbi:hypothetical protein P0082_09775 [Candidatus Haliotispira prima]|uniref:Uncharacterized protein n=1 Tax=Candidatus Haliotispira prima TaxID=3034016 RepID=A0ABY8MFS6_9SPIO|nr:hypothetical protein P0082_09775 [Candidatus Haliotispira prima]
MLGCAPLPDTGDPPAAPKPSISFATAAMVSSVQLEMSSSLALANIGAVIRLAAEAAPTKTEAEANAGYVSLAITAGSPTKFSISQHYGSDFANGLTLVDVLAPNTQYKLYLFFEPNAVSSESTVEGATLANNMVVLPFTTTVLPPAGEAVWDNAWTNKQFVGSLTEWGYSQNQKGIFVAYTKVNTFIVTLTVTNRKADNTVLQSFGSLALGLASPGTGFLFELSELGGSYPDPDEYYYVIGADDTKTLSGEAFQLEIDNGSKETLFRVPLTRYSSP